MAAGDLTIFNEARAYMFDGGWEAADDLKLALITSATVPTASDTTPSLGDYTQVSTGGNYSAGGISIGNWGNFVSQSGGTVTMDSATNPSWAQNASNPTNARYALLYNDTDAGDAALGFVDLGATIDMTLGSLTVTWHASGFATMTVA